ncbi:recombinase family protein [Dyadobacter sp. CY347]|uniref:recombinase family protein n=1 Tax=Dyadobacter sp. CY347 TaxID=2909336 RepID=UPI001F16D22D|nr:recombinase family protein [Dyadobacter sp. CY347]MCF2491478.1 recombinase family protein [Dyadobacter sp. CY347]
MKRAVAYFRVSTDRQGKSGLGLEAQHEAVHLFAHHQGYQVTAEFTEIESGKKNERPELMAALLLCKKEKAMLIIAKLDRLGRNVAFIANLMESKVEFLAVDNPHANPLMVHLLAAFAEHERKQISTRTKEALQAAKRRGVQLGKHGREIESKKNSKAAGQFAETMQPIIKALKADGFTTVRGISDELNRRGVETFRNGSEQWHRTTVHRLLKRLYIGKH